MVYHIKPGGLYRDDELIMRPDGKLVAPIVLDYMAKHAIFTALQHFEKQSLEPIEVSIRFCSAGENILSPDDIIVKTISTEEVEEMLKVSEEKPALKPIEIPRL